MESTIEIRETNEAANGTQTEKMPLPSPSPELVDLATVKKQTHENEMEVPAATQSVENETEMPPATQSVENETEMPPATQSIENIENADTMPLPENGKCEIDTPVKADRNNSDVANEKMDITTPVHSSNPSLPDAPQKKRESEKQFDDKSPKKSKIDFDNGGSSDSDDEDLSTRYMKRKQVSSGIPPVSGSNDE